jgi:hypothetical protein
MLMDQDQEQIMFCYVNMHLPAAEGEMRETSICQIESKQISIIIYSSL